MIVLLPIETVSRSRDRGGRLATGDPVAQSANGDRRLCQRFLDFWRQHRHGFNGLRDLRQLLMNRLPGIADLGRKADRDARALKAIPEGLRLSPSGFNGSRFGNRAWALSAASSARSRPRTAIAASMSPGGAEGGIVLRTTPSTAGTAARGTSLRSRSSGRANSIRLDRRISVLPLSIFEMWLCGTPMRARDRAGRGPWPPAPLSVP